MKIAHVSDIHHLKLNNIRFCHFLNSRIVGGINLLFARSKLHKTALTHMAFEQIAAMSPDCLVISGDLSNLAFDSEFEGLRDILRRYFPDDRVVMVPGNHDRYTIGSYFAKNFDKVFRDYLKSDMEFAGGWPIVRFFDKHTIVALDSTRIHPVLYSDGKVGAKQLAALERILSDPRVRDTYRVIVLHHHLFRAKFSPGESMRKLRDDKALLDILKKYDVDLVLHGHNHIHGFYEHGKTKILETGSLNIDHPMHPEKNGKFSMIDTRDKRVETYKYDDGAYTLFATRNL